MINEDLDKIDFTEIATRSIAFADKIDKNLESLAKSLEGFETYDVVIDEINRSVDLLRNLDKNRDYFKYKIESVVAFLPLNQPLYSTICFGLVPSLMAKSVWVRPPTIVQPHYKKMVEVLDFASFFPNFKISYDEKDRFLLDIKGESEVVIFTGGETGARKVYKTIRPKLFIYNGIGHNPIVVTQSADIEKAIESILRVCLQNQGQDCSAPNSILVQKSVLIEIERLLIERLDKIEGLVGDYSIRKNIIGPNTEPDHVVKICKMFTDLRNFIVKGGQLDVKTSTIHPTLIKIPLETKAMLIEFFAPVIILQPYENDEDLALYFESPQYREHAMYVTVFGSSKYIQSLIPKQLHTKDNILYNTDLHLEERGFLPYGGLGPLASSIYFNGVRIPGATLPQRDIYNFLIKPFMNKVTK